MKNQIKNNTQDTDKETLRRMKRLFSVSWIPKIPFSLPQVQEEVRQIVGKMSLSGVQRKAPIILNKKLKQLEISTEKSTHILKPEPAEYPELAQVENLCMDMAEKMNMDVPPHGVLPMVDKTPAYVVKRFDRLEDGSKLHKEDMAQLMGFSTESKYDASLEKVGKTIRANTTNAFLDVLNFFERVLFNFVIGNGDMHLKNWAVIISKESLGPETKSAIVNLAPCYDFVSSNLYIPGEEESALTINGKRSKLLRKDFETLAQNLELDPKAVNSAFKQILDSEEIIKKMVKESGLSADKKTRFIDLIGDRIGRFKEGKTNPTIHKDSLKSSGFKIQESKKNSADENSEQWLSQEREGALSEMHRNYAKRGFMELTCHPPGSSKKFELEELRTAARGAQIETFGWPIGVVLENNPALTPKPYPGGIRAIIPHLREGREASFDYWALNERGNHYLLTSLFEDQRAENKIFVDSRIVRVTESFMHLSLLYKNLGFDNDAILRITFRHVGLKGRELAFANQARMMFMFENRTSGVDEIGTPLTTRLGDINKNIHELVYKVISELTEMFDFFKPSRIQVVDPIVSDFVAGKIR